MYTLQQQVFAFAMVASADYTANLALAPVLETDLTNAIDKLLKAHCDMGAWTTVWGPVVWEHETTLFGHQIYSKVEDNAMFVVQGTDTGGNPVYVVSIAGTNPKSIFIDVQTEDFESELTGWPYGVPAKPSLSPKVSQGTLYGLAQLLAMQDGTQTLAAFLGGVQDTSKATLIITGHSLGGALAPALALALFGDPGNTATGGAGLTPADWSAVYVYPIAGPAVGDQDYATFYANTFPSITDTQSETWNLLVWNSMDVVPHAWNQLSQIGTLYTGLATSDCLTSIQTALGSAGGSAYVQLPNQQLTGTFVAPTVQLNPVSAFVAEVLYQHIWAYFDLLDVSGLLSTLGEENPLTSAPTTTIGGAVTTLCTVVAGLYCSKSQQVNQCGSPSAVDLTNVVIERPAIVSA